MSPRVGTVRNGCTVTPSVHRFDLTLAVETVAFVIRGLSFTSTSEIVKSASRLCFGSNTEWCEKSLGWLRGGLKLDQIRLDCI